MAWVRVLVSRGVAPSGAEPRKRSGPRVSRTTALGEDQGRAGGPPLPCARRGWLPPASDSPTTDPKHLPFLEHDRAVDSLSPHIDGRIDRYVQELVGESRAFVTGLFDHGCVRVNGEPASDGSRRLQAGDIVAVRYEADRRYAPKPPRRAVARGFDVVFEDEHMLVVEKPPELLTVPTPAGESNTLMDRVAAYVRAQDKKLGAWVVHRLDRGVSGLLVFGKSREIAEALQEQFAARKPEREYQALLAGSLPRDAGTFESRLVTAANLTRYSTRTAREGELAITHFRVILRTAEVTHAVLRLETGRRNQIRVHCAEAGHPVLGDPRYRPDLSCGPLWRTKRMALHAATLGFAHPRTRAMLRFASELPVEMAELLKRLH
jgi:23S rRNA pseudouridine1911/1915/1917 synthase